VAMLAAARGEPSTIGFSGPAQYDYAPDLGRAFVAAATADVEGARVYNTPGAPASVEDVAEAIRAVVPDAEIASEGGSLPFPAALEAVGFERELGPYPRTSLAEGVAATIAHFRSTGAASAARG
jgi:nucleoside-diphosphate-sugar epimerase